MDNGGAIQGKKVQNIYLKNNTIEYCIAKINGGAIYLDNFINVSIISSKI